jgi:hypothetical protein
VSFFVLRAEWSQAGLLDEWPKGGPPAERWLAGVSLKNEVKGQLAMAFSTEASTRKELADFQPNRLGALVVSAKARAVLSRLAMKNVEFFDLTLKDQKGKVVSRDHALVNLVGLEDAIDEKRTKGTPVPGTPGRFSHVDELHLMPRRVHPGARLFRCSAMPQLILARDAVRELVLGGRLTGGSFEEAEGWTPRR